MALEKNMPCLTAEDLQSKWNGLLVPPQDARALGTGGYMDYRIKPWHERRPIRQRPQRPDPAGGRGGEWGHQPEDVTAEACDGTARHKIDLGHWLSWYCGSTGSFG